MTTTATITTTCPDWCRTDHDDERRSREAWKARDMAKLLREGYAPTPWLDRSVTHRLQTSDDPAAVVSVDRWEDGRESETVVSVQVPDDGLTATQARGLILALAAAVKVLEGVTDEDRVLRHWGRNLKTARERAGLTPGELGDASDVAANTITRVEAGQHEPTIWLRLNLCKALNLDGGVLWDFPPRVSLDDLLFQA